MKLIEMQQYIMNRYKEIAKLYDTYHYTLYCDPDYYNIEEDEICFIDIAYDGDNIKVHLPSAYFEDDGLGRCEEFLVRKRNKEVQAQEEVQADKLESDKLLYERLKKRFEVTR
jgi:hypothetical protein